MKNLLDEINSSADVKKLNTPELKILAEEIRSFLVENISKSGGHLASNLGTVEITLALHKVFDFSSDRIIWDVGHQSYTHKILTGRKNDFSTLRQQGGISGFPKTQESDTDAFNTGHSSTSVSAALGFAKAFELSQKDARAIAVIGDGALTGGMAFEALNHAGSAKVPLIVILNDNGMSISENVGGMSLRLQKIRSHSRYIGAKATVTKILKVLPLVGTPFIKFLHVSKRFLKKFLLRNQPFKDMNLEYLGPIDGHDLKELITVIDYAKSLDKPVVIHAMTQKGKGFAPSEESPEHFHGIGSFDPETGAEKPASCETYSDTFGAEMLRLGNENPNIVAITAAMPLGTGLDKFAIEFPHRFFDVGIAEQHAVTFSAALAKAGQIPILAVYSTFLQRGYDQIIHDVALQNLHVVFAIDRAGASGNDGETHQGIYDLSYLSHIPNLAILAPSTNTELKEMLRFAVNDCDGPVAIRYPKGSNHDGISSSPVTMGKGVIEKEGNDILIVALGSMVSECLRTSELLEKQGVSATVLNARFLKPFDENLLKTTAKGKKLIVVAEDNVEIGGLGDTVRRIIFQKTISFAFPDQPLAQGNVSEQKLSAGLNAENMAEKILKTLEGDNLG